MEAPDHHRYYEDEFLYSLLSLNRQLRGAYRYLVKELPEGGENAV
jgi:hypothetical protein